MSLNKSQSSLSNSIKVFDIPSSVDKNQILDHFKSKGAVIDTEIGDDYILMTFADHVQKTNSLSSQGLSLSNDYSVKLDPLTASQENEDNYEDDFEVVNEVENALMKSLNDEITNKKEEDSEISKHYEVLHDENEDKLKESISKEKEPSELEMSKYEIITGKTNKAQNDPFAQVFTKNYFLSFTLVWAAVLFIRSLL